ncbi:HAD family phosphatase [Aeromicrobium panaciterrae]|uniref:HAD family hydrolase n=1 Tax=Aeromicrobium panaciterrae TaxID=363861 RepID=UPI0031CF0F97
MSKWSQRPARGIIFDFNGTLSNDEPILEQIFTGLFRDHLGWAMSAHEYTTRLLGRSDREIVEFAVREHGSGEVSLVERLLTLRSEKYREIVATESPITSGVLDLVRLLHNAAVPMAIVTGAQRADVRAVLDNSEVGAMIPVLVAEEDVTRGKPDPEGFLIAADLLGLQPADLLVFEDSIPGAAAAANAKMTCIAVSDGPSDALTSTVAAHVTTLDSRILTNVVL